MDNWNIPRCRCGQEMAPGQFMGRDAWLCRTHINSIGVVTDNHWQGYLNKEHGYNPVKMEGPGRYYMRHFSDMENPDMGAFYVYRIAHQQPVIVGRFQYGFASIEPRINARNRAEAHMNALNDMLNGIEPEPEEEELDTLLN